MKIQALHSIDKIKTVADPRRMDILRRLMAGPATLTHLAQAMRRSPAWIRHHILALEAADLVEISEIRRTGRVIEKFYRAKADALLLQELILPKSKRSVIIFAGSHDLALEMIAERLQKQVTLLSLPVGSLDGLTNLRQRLCQVAGSHLLAESGEYNTPFVRHIFPDRDMQIVTLAYRTQGLMLAPGNPKGVKDLQGLLKPAVRFVNRNPGSGTRLWFDRALREQHIPADEITGSARVVRTHSEAAALVENGKADAALGLQAAAHRHGLEFIPLFEERYDLVLPREHEASLSPFLEYLQTAHFRQELQRLTGYSTTHSGQQVPL